MTSEDNDPVGWKALQQFVGSMKDGPVYWGDVVGNVEALVTSRGTIVLCKDYSTRGMKLDTPWLELTESELRGVLARGEELLAAMNRGRREPEAKRKSPQ